MSSVDVLPPIPQSGLNNGERRDGGSVGAQDAGPERKPQHIGFVEDIFAFGFVEAANAPVPINGVGHAEPVNGAAEAASSGTPLRAAINA